MPDFVRCSRSLELCSLLFLVCSFGGVYMHPLSVCFSFSVDSGAQAAAWVLLRISPAWLRIICSALSCLGPLKSSLSALALCECKENMLGPYLKPLAPPGAVCVAPQLWIWALLMRGSCSCASVVATPVVMHQVLLWDRPGLYLLAGISHLWSSNSREKKKKHG